MVGPRPRAGREDRMTPDISVRVVVLALCCLMLGAMPAATGQLPIVLAGATGGICAAQFDKCMGRCRGSTVCASRCTENDHACRVGGKPRFR
jgi:hypothetical protein